MHKILIIDDDSDTLASMQSLLGLNKYEVEVSAKWHDVFQRVENFQPDLIIMDVFLDGIDGRNICKQLKKESATRHIPVIMYSGNEAVADHILSYGADEFILKPIAVPELLEKIKTLIKTPELKR